MESRPPPLVCNLCAALLQSSDVVVLADPENPLWMFGAEVTDDGQ